MIGRFVDSLEGLFNNKFEELRQGKRLSASYFDVRYYPGVRSIHFYPTNKKVIERLNMLVGKERQWLPEDDNKASKSFWKQYEKAEQVTKSMIVNVTKWGRLEDDDEKLIQAHQVACDRLGFDTANMLA